MQIDWVTVTAQIVNFLILVVLLQRFLYRPVMQAMHKREKRIADRLDEAEKREAEAEREAAACRGEKERLERERQSILEAYRESAREEKLRLLDQAREEVEQSRRNWQNQVDKEKREFLEGLRHRLGQAVTDLANRALSDLANAELEERVIDTFIERLDSTEEEALQSLARGDGRLIITTAHAFGELQRERIEHALRERLGEGLVFEYAESDELVFGIRLGRGGYAFDWNLADYLDQVAHGLRDAMGDLPRQA